MTTAKNRTAKNPALRRIFIILGVILALFIARQAIGFGSAWVHYRNTPKFEEYLTGTLTPDKTLDKAFGEAEVVSTTDGFLVGEIDPVTLIEKEGDYLRATRRVSITLLHGQLSLLQFSQEFHQSLDRETWARRGFRVDPPSIQSHPDMRVISEARIFGLDEMFDQEEPGRGGVILDIVIASGAGDEVSRISRGDRSSVIRLDSPEFDLGGLYTGMKNPFPLWRRISGITHNLKPLPEEGLVHHFQHTVSFDLIKVDGGSQGPSTRHPVHAVSTNEFSYEWKTVNEDFLDGRPRGSSTLSTKSSREWMGEVR